MRNDTRDNGTSPHRHAPRVVSESFPPDFENPGVFPFAEANRIKNEQLGGIWYLNPIARVHSPEDSEEFAETVAKRPAEWFRHLSRQFRNCWRSVRNQASLWQRAYEFDGVIVVNHSSIPFPVWREQIRGRRCEDYW